MEAEKEEDADGDDEGFETYSEEDVSDDEDEESGQNKKN